MYPTGLEKKRKKKSIFVCTLILLFIFVEVINIKKQTMKTTINAYQFVNEMVNHGFTRKGAFALFEYFEDYELNTNDEEIEFDPISFRCEYTEYNNIEEIAREYGEEFEDIEHLQNYTQVIEFESGIIIYNF